MNAALDRRSSGALWAPDSKSVVFTAGDHGKVAIYRTPFEGGVSVPLIDGKAQAGAVSVAKDGTLVFTMASQSKPGELFALDGTQSGPITSLNEDLVKQWELAAPEEISFRSLMRTP